MWYKKFEFRNFKGIDELVLPLDGDVTTLIGLNESGKTTILEAIFCFSYGAEDLEMLNPGLASLRDPEQWIPISKRANFNDSVEIKALVGLDDTDRAELKKYLRHSHGLTMTNQVDEVWITEKYPFANSRVGEIERLWSLDVRGVKGQQRNARAYGGKTEEWQGSIKFLKTRLPRILYFPNFLFDLPERFELSDVPGGEKEQQDRNTFYRATFESILTQLGYGANLETHVVSRLKSSDRADQRSLRTVLLDMSRLITQTIFEGWDRIFGQAPAGQEVELEADTDGVGGAFMELRIKGPDGYYDLSERSLGFRWFFMFLMMTSFYAETEDLPSKPLFLLDEPASNLHSSAQAELLKSFENLAQKSALIYTTHSHHLINVRWLDAAYVVKNAALGSLEFSDYVMTRMGARTSISATPYRKFVADHPDQTSYFQPVLDLLDYRPSIVEPVPNVVLVEGKSDFYLLRYATEVLGLQPQITLVPGTGAGTLDPMIRLHVGWGRTFVVLLDGDSEGRAQLSRYKRDFGQLVEGRLALLPDLCGDTKAKEAESLLGPADREAILDAVYPPGQQRPSAKRALRNAVMELYARGEPVSLTSDTSARIECLLRSLEEHLAE